MQGIAHKSRPRRMARAFVLLALAAWTLSSSVSNTFAAAGGTAGETDASAPMLSAPTMMILTVLICCLIGTTEPPASLAPSVAAIEKRNDYNRVLIMSAWLSALSGMVNALCILDMAMTVAHHTGNASHTGRLFGIDSQRFAGAMAGFCAGAMVAGFSKCDGETLFAGRYSSGLLSASVAVAGGAAIQWVHKSPLIAVPLLAFSQGLQNAVTRKYSALPVCTTHMTGYLTDVGSLTGGWLRANVSGTPIPSLKKPAFFLLSILAFGFGGFVAKKSWDEYGITAAFAPAVLMAITSLGLLPAAPLQEKRA